MSIVWIVLGGRVLKKPKSVRPSVGDLPWSEGEG